MPRMELKFNKNVFFFRDASRSFGNIEEFSKKLTEVCLDEEKLAEQLSHQIYIESIIIDQKFRSVKNSIRFFALSFVFIIIIVGFLVLNL